MADNASFYRLHIARDEAPDGPLLVRTLERGGTFTLGTHEADVDLGDPFGRAVYCELSLEGEALSVRCFSEARGAWLYAYADAAAQAAVFGALRATNIDAGVRDPSGHPRLFVRSEKDLVALSLEKLAWLSASERPEGRVERGGVLLVPGATLVLERVAARSARAPERRAALASAPQRPIVAHAVLVPLEQRVRNASTETELEQALDGVCFAAGEQGLRAQRERAEPAGPWHLPAERSGGPARVADDLLAVLRTLGIPPPGARSARVYEVPLMLRVRASGPEPWAVLVAAEPAGPERALLYPLVGEATGLALGKLAAERVARWWHDAPPRLAWNVAAFEPLDGWASEPALPTWEGREKQLDKLLEQFPGGRLRPIDRLWRELQRAVAQELAGKPLPPDIVLEAAARLAFLRRDLTVLGLVAHETLRRKLDALTDERASMRRLPAEQVLALVEWALRALNAGFIGDDNRQKLLNRVAHLLLLFLPSAAAEGGRRYIVLPSGAQVLLDVGPVETHERWVREGAVRRGDRRLFESLTSAGELLTVAASQLAALGHAPPEDRVGDARARLEAILAPD